MNNFFYNNSDYDLFKKALRSTKNEPVIINILSNDRSLMNEEQKSASSPVARKNMSQKFQASPFDKFFGPRKKRTDPLDMKDFSSWKNKNYRESEKQINEAPEQTTKFSFSDYLKSKAKDEKYNDEDELKSELQKPIDQLSIHDDDYKKFSLDSYLNKLEQETKNKKDFDETEDLMGDFGNDDIMASANADQDENFLPDSDVNVETVALDDVLAGENFAFEREELDKVKTRLDKMERESNNIKDKPTTKVISSDEISELKGGEPDEEFSLDKLGVEDDDIESVNAKLDEINSKLQVTGDGVTESPKVEHKRFVEINRTRDPFSTKKDESDSEEKDGSENIDEQNDDNLAVVDSAEHDDVSAELEDKEKKDEGVVKPEIIAGAVATDFDESEEDETFGDEETFVDVVPMSENKGDAAIRSEGKDDVAIHSEGKGDSVRHSGEKIKSQESGDDVSQDDYYDENNENSSEIKRTDDVLTKTDLKDFTNELISKFSELYKGEQNPNAAPDTNYDGGNTLGGYDSDVQQTSVNTETQVNINEQKMYQQQSELQAKIVELIEQNKKSDAEVAEKLQQAEFEKQKVAEQYEARLRELEASMKKSEEEAKQQAYIDKLRSDIKFKKSETSHKMREEEIRETEKVNSQNILASDKLKSEIKSYLDVSNLEMDKRLLECVTKLQKAHRVEEPEPVEEVVEKKPTRTRTTKTASKRRSSTVNSRMRTRTPRRKIDSDIIGGINFD